MLTLNVALYTWATPLFRGGSRPYLAREMPFLTEFSSFLSEMFHGRNDCADCSWTNVATCGIIPLDGKDWGRHYFAQNSSQVLHTKETEGIT